jgi:hypothetical protein
MLADAGLKHERSRLRPVSHFHQLQGMCGATFIYIENHASPVPYEMLIYARTMGLVEMKLNDEAARARHGVPVINGGNWRGAHDPHVR